jgi:hypothetical protein
MQFPPVTASYGSEGEYVMAPEHWNDGVMEVKKYPIFQYSNELNHPRLEAEGF